MRAMMLFFFATALLAACGGSRTSSSSAMAPAPAADAPNLTLDVKAVVAGSKDGKAAIAKFRASYEVRQRELNERFEKLKQRKAELDRQRTSIPEDEFNRLLNDWERDKRDLQALLDRGNEELAAEQKRVSAPIVRRFMQLLPKLAANTGAHAIYDAAAECESPARSQRLNCVAWSARPGIATTDTEWFKPRTDITDRAVRAMDAEGEP
jgi:Skp family chaperone for outer membrane proteins